MTDDNPWVDKPEINVPYTQEEFRLRCILREIWQICHVPTSETPYRAYTHFQADFDYIRALTKPFA